jgi:hypothetical protein
MVKQLKNRYNDLAINKRFVIGVDKSKMRLYDVEDSAQTLADSGQEEQPVLGNKDYTKPETKQKFRSLKV